MTDQTEFDLKTVCIAFANECNSLTIGNRWISFRSLNMITRVQPSNESATQEEYLVLSLSTGEEIVLSPKESAEFYEKMKHAAAVITNTVSQAQRDAMLFASQALNIGKPH